MRGMMVQGCTREESDVRRPRLVGIAYPMPGSAAGTGDVLPGPLR